MKWQPIETAPKGRENFLAWDGCNVEMVSRSGDGFVSSTGFFINIHPEDMTPDCFDAEGTIVDDFPVYFIYATHWMPLPEAPEATS